MTANDQLRALTDSIDQLRQRCATHGHELLRRASISAQTDGYPRRASGSDRSTAPIPLEWQCTCGDAGTGNGDRHLATMTAAGQVWHHIDITAAIGTDYSDPTGQAAVSAQIAQADPVRERGRRFMAHLAKAEQELAHAANALDERPNTEPGDPTCESCARITHPDGRPFLSPVHAKLRAPSDVGGRLSSPRWLCRWCYDAVAGQPLTPGRGTLPPRDLVKEYLERGRVRRSA